MLGIFMYGLIVIYLHCYSSLVIFPVEYAQLSLIIGFTLILGVNELHKYNGDEFGENPIVVGKHLKLD